MTTDLDRFAAIIDKKFRAKFGEDPVKVIDPTAWDAWCEECGEVVEAYEKLDPIGDPFDVTSIYVEPLIVYPCRHGQGFSIKRPGPVLAEINPEA